MKTLLDFVRVVGRQAGVTVAAAQGSQPGEPIFAIKAGPSRRTLSCSRTQVGAQVTGQSVQDPGVAEPDRIQLQTQDMQQDQDRIQLQTQDILQTQEPCEPTNSDQDKLQTQDILQNSGSVQQSPGSGQKARSGATGDKEMTGRHAPSTGSRS